MITFTDVVKVYDNGTRAVDGLSLEAPTGRITVLVGPSGCGKTTSLRMINRMIEPTAGTISIDGDDVSGLNANDLRRRIGYVIQSGGLFPHRTVIDNIATVPRLLGTGRRKARADGMDLLERVGLDAGLAGRYPAQLSGGQQQRVGVARALAADPPIMLMDEPFSAVDPQVRAQLQDEFLRLQAELGKTIVFVTHDIDEAIRLGDEVAVLRVGGTLAQLDPPERLLADPADDFVADFLGHDRGYQRLGFTASPDLPLTTEATVALGTDAAQARHVADSQQPAWRRPWLLVVDEDGAPAGWVRPEAVGTTVEPADLHRGGTVARLGGTLRAALDAALSSPSRRGVMVDDAGRLAGTVLARDVLSAIEEVGRAPSTRQGSPTNPQQGGQPPSTRQGSPTNPQQGGQPPSTRQGSLTPRAGERAGEGGSQDGGEGEGQ